ncbi:Transcription termination factor MTEF1, chloroplastic-like protein [Drosera capensis]
MVVMAPGLPGLLMMRVEGNLGKKVEYFREVMKEDLEEIKWFPQYFLCGLEGKIKRRHTMLVEHGFSMSLGKMFKCSNGEFEAHLIKMRLWPADDRRSNKCNSKVQPFGQGLLPKQNEKEIPGERSLRSWQPPPFGRVKINVDAAVQVEATFVGCIARNHQGKVLKAYCAKLPAFDPLTAEAEGYKAPARWAISTGFEDVIIEGDAKRVVDSCNKGVRAPYGWQVATTLQCIQGLSRSLEATEVKFVPRERNTAAYELCQWAARTVNLGHIESYALPLRMWC